MELLILLLITQYVNILFIHFFFRCFPECIERMGPHFKSNFPRFNIPKSYPIGNAKFNRTLSKVAAFLDAQFLSEVIESQKVLKYQGSNRDPNDFDTYRRSTSSSTNSVSMNPITSDDFS